MLLVYSELYTDETDMRHIKQTKMQLLKKTFFVADELKDIKICIKFAILLVKF